MLLNLKKPNLNFFPLSGLKGLENKIFKLLKGKLISTVQFLSKILGLFILPLILTLVFNPFKLKFLKAQAELFLLNLLLS